MEVLAPQPSQTGRAKAIVLVFAALAGVAIGMTWLFLGMRAVMDIGGYCAEGGAFVIRQTCPDGVPGLMIGGIWGGVVFLGIYVWQAGKAGIPSLVFLAWPALFLSLGWNFLEYGIDPPFGGGLEWGWLVCAVVFIAMGGLPLWFIVPALTASVRSRGRQPLEGGVLAEQRSTYLRGALVIQGAAIATGIYLGMRFFNAITT